MNQLEEEKEKVQSSELQHQDKTSNWLAEQNILKEQLLDLQTRNDNLQMSLVNRDMTIEKLVRIISYAKKIHQYLLVMCTTWVSIYDNWYLTRTSSVYLFIFNRLHHTIFLM